IGDEPVRAKPEPLTSAQIAARLSVAEWSRVRAIFPFEANCRAIKAELRRRILAGQPTGISAVRTIEYIPAI
ncbi:MAG TPA: hypothetical protein VG944_08165, partial [Fimbriimonas sp.]|nr:hypothetical protein [Fimbriimonas sp.]